MRLHHAPSLLALLTALGCGAEAASEPPPRTEPVEPSAGDESAAALPPSGDLAAAIAGPQRSEGNRARDVHRHPQQTLEFFGVGPDMRVLEIRPGGGWYTEILAPYLREQGALAVAIPSAEGRRARYRQRFLDLQRERPDVLGAAEVVTFDPPETLELEADGSYDMIVTFRNTHNMVGDDAAEAAFAAFFRALRPGGILGVVQHRAAPDADPATSAEQGYLPEAYVVRTAEAAGFQLEESSEINANPEDTRDHPEGVWTLPPVLRLGEEDRERYEAVGESDRMTLRFRKPE
jgi:predicted methyltransferase